MLLSKERDDARTNKTRKPAEGATAKPKGKGGKKDKAALKGMTFAEGEQALAPEAEQPTRRKVANEGVLARGDQGPEVLALQQALLRLSLEGHAGDHSLVAYFKAAYDPGALNGKFTAKVEAAVKELQRNCMLPMDGIYDEGTASCMAQVLEALDQASADKGGKKKGD